MSTEIKIQKFYSQIDSNGSIFIMKTNKISKIINHISIIVLELRDARKNGCYIIVSALIERL